MFVVDKITSLIGRQYTAYLCILIGIVLWPIGLMTGAQIYYASTFYIGFLRGLATVIVFFIMAKIYGHRIDFKNSKDFKIIVIRTLIMNGQQFVMSYSLKYLQTPIVHTISNCGPIIVFILNYFIHKITVSGRQFVGIIIASVSLLIAINSIVIYHWLGYESYQKSSHYQYEQSSIHFKIFLCIILFGEHILWAYGIVITKQLKQTNSIQLNYIGGVLLTIVSSIFYPLSPNTQVIRPPQFIYSLLTTGFILCINTFFYISAIILAKNTGNVTIIGFSSVVVGYGISFFRYGETPNIFGILGSIGILIGLVLILYKSTTTVKQ